MASPINNPEVPFVGPISGGLHDGRIIRIQGFTSPIAQRFNINLKAGSLEDDDIAFHLSVRLTEGYIARNSCINGEWGDEQGEGELHIGAGQKFEVLILTTTNDYKVAVNGKHFCEFTQRISPHKVTHLAIDGDLTLSLISYEGGDMESRTASSQQQSGGQFGGYNQYGPPQGQYGPPPGQYGPPSGQYGPPQDQYGPPQGHYGGYGQQPYAPPAPPGHQPESSSSDFLSTAGSLIAGAISSGMADKLIGSLTGGGAHQGQANPSQQPQQHPQQPQQPQQQQLPFGLPQLGGQGSVGGLGSIGSLLSNFAEDILKPRKVLGFVAPRPSAPPAAGIHPPPTGIYPTVHTIPQHQLYPTLPNSTYNLQPYATLPNATYNSQAQPYPLFQGAPNYSYPSHNQPIPTSFNPSYPQPSVIPSQQAGGIYPYSAPTYSHGKESKLNKALKYGVPILGAGVASYAISKVLSVPKFGTHWGCSSSSSCSDSD